MQSGILSMTISKPSCVLTKYRELETLSNTQEPSTSPNLTQLSPKKSISHVSKVHQLPIKKGRIIHDLHGLSDVPKPLFQHWKFSKEAFRLISLWKNVLILPHQTMDFNSKVLSLQAAILIKANLQDINRNAKMEQRQKQIRSPHTSTTCKTEEASAYQWQKHYAQ